MKLTRKQKIVRNIAVCILMSLAIYAAMDFPPYTVQAMCRREQANFLLGDEIEPLYVLKEGHSYSGDMFKRRFTFIIGRSGENYIAFQYDWHLLNNEWDAVRGGDIAAGALCTARNGTMYIAGDFAGAASATAVVRAEKGEKQRDFTLTGEKLAGEVFGFDVTNGTGRTWYYDSLAKREDEMSLCDISQYWYRTPTQSGGYGLDHADLPVTLTLYDEAGEALDTLALTVGTYDLHSWR